MVTTPIRAVTSDFGLVEVGWDGRPLNQQLLAIDTETLVIEDESVIPRLVLVSVSDGERHVVLPPSQLPAFLRAHRDARWLMFNAAFDFWGLHQELQRLGDAQDVAGLLWTKAAHGGIGDPMLLAMLLELAELGEVPRTGHSLEDLCAACGVDAGIDKQADDRYRLHYEQLLDVELDTVTDEGWFTYAARDAYATILLYNTLAERVLKLEDRLGRDLREWGPLTEQIQVQAAIALARVRRNGVWIDKERLEEVTHQLRQQIEALVSEAQTRLEDDPRFATIGKVFESVDGQMKTGRNKLQRVLGTVRSDIEATGRSVFLPTNKGGGITTGGDEWARYADAHPFLGPWLEATRASKLLSLLPQSGGRIHPCFTTLVATGRTSCRSPNVQQIPRDSRVRSVYVPGPGKVLISADYSYIELVTLAQICLDRYGRSMLAEMIVAGKDPHKVTAAGIMGITYEEFDTGLQRDPETFKMKRQQAKAVNFGVPGGMGAEALRCYARDSFRVELTVEEAQEYRRRLVTDIFPEVGLYLREDLLANLCGNLHCTEKELLDAFGQSELPEWLTGMIRRIVGGETLNASGQPYADRTLTQVWEALDAVNRNRGLGLRRSGAGRSLRDALFSARVVLPTGRVRGNCLYTAAHNTPFQGLAADGAKLALFELTRLGFRVVGFIHDEIIVEVDETDDLEDRKAELRRVMIEQMRRVTPGVVVGVGEPQIGHSWAKN